MDEGSRGGDATGGTPPPGRTALVVLGMHRSGTSAMAGTLAALGAAAPRTPMEAAEANAAGFYESAPVFDLHNALLPAVGSDWCDWRRLDPDRLTDAAGAAFADRALAVLEGEFAAAPLFVLKDPRICRLVPFWRAALDRLGATPRYVLVHRNPADVAASLRARDGLDPLVGRLLWLRHVLDAEADTRGAARAFASYEALLDDWRGTIGSLRSRLGLAAPREAAEAGAEIDAFLQPMLRHHATPAEVSAGHPPIDGWVREVHRLLERWARSGEDPTDRAALDRVRAALSAFEAMVMRTVRPAPGGLTDADGRPAADAPLVTRAGLAPALIELLAQEMRTLSDALDASRADGARLRATRGGGAMQGDPGDAAGLRAAREAAEARLADAAREHDRTLQSHAWEMERAQERSAAQEADLAAARRDLAGREMQVAELEAALASAGEQSAAQAQTVAAAQEAVEAMRASSSWRVTTPLRAIGSLRRRGRPPPAG